MHLIICTGDRKMDVNCSGWQKELMGQGEGKGGVYRSVAGICSNSVVHMCLNALRNSVINNEIDTFVSFTCSFTFVFNKWEKCMYVK